MIDVYELAKHYGQPLPETEVLFVACFAFVLLGLSLLIVKILEME